MNCVGILLLCLATIAKASLVLTLCPASSGVSVPCLNDTVSGTTTNLQLPSSNQAYNFSHLNITAIQDLPSDAKYVDLSYNQINTISRPLPSTLEFLNLSHNALRSKWILTSIAVSTLDVSYNQWGLPWFENITWKESLPKLARLIFRGNNLSILRLNGRTLPVEPHPFSALDVSDNPNVIFVIQTNYNYKYLQQAVTITTDQLDALNFEVCKLATQSNRTMNLTLERVSVEYLSQGEAKYNRTNTTQFDVCIGPLPDPGTF
ncbi:unnamed protein product [Aphanomyces euteiches]